MEYDLQPEGTLMGVEIIREERRRQIWEEKFTPKHDAEHKDESLAWVAAIYAAPGIILVNKELAFEGRSYYQPWPQSWSRKWDKRGKHDRIKQLAIAGALCAAEIDRLQAEGETEL